ncbi:hypothetical protein H8959_003576 [Pygathrix nigripes]
MDEQTQNGKFHVAPASPGRGPTLLTFSWESPKAAEAEKAQVPPPRRDGAEVRSKRAPDSPAGLEPVIPQPLHDAHPGWLLFFPVLTGRACASQ